MIEGLYIKSKVETQILGVFKTEPTQDKPIKPDRKFENQIKTENIGFFRFLFLPNRSVRFGSRFYN